jgi:hypothetical protein
MEAPQNHQGGKDILKLKIIGTVPAMRVVAEARVVGAPGSQVSAD